MSSRKEKWRKARIMITPCYPLQPLAQSHRELKSTKQKDIFELLHPLEGKIILDAGTGEGFFAINLALSGAYSVIAFDMSEKMLQRARENSRVAKVDSKIVFIQGDIENLPLRSCSSDAVVAIAVLVHLPNPRKAIAEWARVLKNEGQLIMDFVPFNLVPVHGLFDITLNNPTLRERVSRFLGVALMDYLSLIFGFAWRKTSATHWLYYIFFSIPVRHYTKRGVLRLLQQCGIYPVSIKRYGQRLWPFEFRIYGKKQGE